MKKGIVLSLSLVLGSVILASCGGGGGSSSSSGGASSGAGEENEPETQNCLVIMNTVTIANGGSCNLVQEDADTYGVSAGELSCDAGTLIYEGNRFSSGGNGVTFNGLSFICTDS